MRTRCLISVCLLCAIAGLALRANAQVIQNYEERTHGEQIDPASFGPGVVETWEQIVARDEQSPPPEYKKGQRNGSHGFWQVPSPRSLFYPHSGTFYAINKWGDTRMGIGFPQVVDVHGAVFAGQGGPGVWTPGVRVIGYRAGQQVAQTDWFTDIDDVPTWFPMNLEGVDRIVIESQPVVQGGGWYALDDLTFSPHTDQFVSADDITVVDFEDLRFRFKLTGSNYAGLTWETGHGEFAQPTDDITTMPPPVSPSDKEGDNKSEDPLLDDPSRDGTQPLPMQDFEAVDFGEGGAIPPDSMGAIGQYYYVAVVNQRVGGYAKATGSEVYGVSLGSFFDTSALIGDPRIVYDQFSDRYIIIATTYSDTKRIYIAVSSGPNPFWGGSWFKTYFQANQGSDGSKWPDYPTLGVDENGIYVAATMFGWSTTNTIWAIDKDPLIQPDPYLGTVTAFRGLTNDGATQPAHTYGTPGIQYLVSRRSSSYLRLRGIEPPLTNPTLVTIDSTLNASAGSNPPDAAAQGSTTPIDTGDARLQMAVYRDGYLWTCNTISYGGRSACRWYKINVNTTSIADYGTVYDSSLYFYYPSVMVNAMGHAIMGFSGSNSYQYAGAYYCGRRADDPAGDMSTPVQYREGNGPYTIVDGYGRNRWGDYSYTTLDPEDDLTFWTIQEYAKGTDDWSTWVQVLTYDGFLDCNGNEIPDDEDLADCDGSPWCSDCNNNGILDVCDIDDGTSNDANGNGIPDECEDWEDCNNNGLPDHEDISGGVSEDCNDNGVPDECELQVTNGLVAAYYDGLDFTGNLRGRLDDNINFNWGTGSPWPSFDGNQFSVRWTGYLQSFYLNGVYEFQTFTDDGVRLWVNGQLIIDQWQDQGATEHTGTIYLAGDTVYSLVMEYYENSGSAIAQLTWKPPGQLQEQIPAENLFPAADCNANNTPDDCDLDSGASEDCNENGRLDECDIAEGWSADCNSDNIPDECQLDGNDCNNDSIPDDCQLAGNDCNNDNIPDDCQLDGNDCNSDGIPDDCQLADNDCNENGVPDDCDIADGTSEDTNGNGIPDECESMQTPGDTDCDGDVDFDDISPFVLALSGESAYNAEYPDCNWLNADCNEDGNVNFDDIAPFVNLIGSSPQ